MRAPVESHLGGCLPRQQVIGICHRRKSPAPALGCACLGHDVACRDDVVFMSTFITCTGCKIGEKTIRNRGNIDANLNYAGYSNCDFFDAHDFPCFPQTLAGSRSSYRSRTMLTALR